MQFKYDNHSTCVYVSFLLIVFAISSCSGSGEQSLPIAQGSSDNNPGISSDPGIAPDSVIELVEPSDESIPSHRVDLEITVPEYQSDALQVLLVIGSGRYKASWVQDETWSVSVDLPSNANIYPTVFFFDRDGDVLLAWSKQRFFETSIGPRETLKLPADVGSHYYIYADTDRDGVSNMEELISGTDHKVSEGSLITGTSVVLPLLFHDMFKLSERYETLIPLDRPYTLDVVDPNPVKITLDAKGNGSYSSAEREGDHDNSFIKQAGTRSVSDLGVTWKGQYSRINFERQEELEFTSQTTRYSDFTYGQVGMQTAIIGGNNPSRGEFSYSVVGDSYGGDGRCAARYGRFTSVLSERFKEPSEMDNILGSAQRYILSGTSSPESSELGWRFTRELFGVELENYRVLNVDETFYCDFGDL